MSTGKWIVVAVIFGLVGYIAYYYFAVYKPQQEAYANLHQALQDAAASTQNLLNQIPPADRNTTPTVPAQASSVQSSTTGAQTITVNNDSPKGAFTIQLPDAWKQVNGASWSNGDTTYIAIQVPSNDSKDMPNLSLQVAAYTGDPSTIDSGLRNSIKAAFTAATNAQLSSITVPGADEAVMGTATGNVGGVEFTYVEVRAYKAGSNFDSHVYKVSFAAETASPAVATIKQAIATMKVTY